MTLAAFLLALAAFVGTIMILADPTHRFASWARGKTGSEIDAEARLLIEKTPGAALGKGCSFVGFIALSFLFTYFIDPVAVLYALTHQAGNQVVAYAMLAIIGLAWFNFAKQFLVKKPEVKLQGNEEELPLPSVELQWTRRIVFSLPTLYLWYLFATVMGWVS